jgi:hypothetical protein
MGREGLLHVQHRRHAPPRGGEHREERIALRVDLAAAANGKSGAGLSAKDSRAGSVALQHVTGADAGARLAAKSGPPVRILLIFDPAVIAWRSRRNPASR